jgi:catechol 2,3-dioxygenase-like lactoylglutathione lyase family enzyme
MCVGSHGARIHVFGRLGMKNIRLNSFGLCSVAAMILVCTPLLEIAFTGSNQPMSQSRNIPGIAFESVTVSNLEKSVNYYKALGFTVAGEASPPWSKDEAENRLYNTPGALSRTAQLTVASTSSGEPFVLYLREYKDLKRRNRVNFPARNPSATHIGLMVPDADTLWAQMKSAGILRALSWDEKLVRMPGQTAGGIAYVMDPDGFNIELVGLSQTPAATHASLHHVGLAVLSSEKSRAFYGNLLGAIFSKTTPEWLSGDMYDAAVGGRGFVIRLINGTFPEAAAPQKTMPFELVEYQKPTRPDVDDYRYSDIAVSCVGLQVDGIDALYTRLQAAGLPAWSSGGIVQKKDGTRAVVVRDPDVGAFVELFEKR